MSPDQYLEVERAAEHKTEYIDGQMVPFASVNHHHALIVTNITWALETQLRLGPCEIYGSDMKVRMKPQGPFAYPDVIVVCGEPIFLDNHLDVLLNPKVIVEVLSPSTQSYDRGKKFVAYRHIPSLTEYLLIAQDRAHIDHFVVQPDGSWPPSSVSGLDGVVELPSVGATLKLSDVYHRVSL